jgi:hypothetical protein
MSTQALPAAESSDLIAAEVSDAARVVALRGQLAELQRQNDFFRARLTKIVEHCGAVRCNDADTSLAAFLYRYAAEALRLVKS